MASKPRMGMFPSTGTVRHITTAVETRMRLRAIESADSDVDTFSNLAEITALTFPGDKKDYPGLSPAHVVVMNQERILKLKGYSQFYLNNASKSTDWYARYYGARIVTF